jgi:hypothetical protein
MYKAKLNMHAQTYTGQQVKYLQLSDFIKNLNVQTYFSKTPQCEIY